jgi:YidC/Oxa1 family membrane protein insertase
MFTITDHIHNATGSAVTLYPFGLVARQSETVQPASRLYEGPLGVVNGTLKEYAYKKLIEDGKKTEESEGGWVGITDKYWLVAMILPGDEKLAAEFSYNGGAASANDAGQAPKLGWFQADYRGLPMTVAPGASIEHTELLFAGAKRVRLLDHYVKVYGIPHFDRAIDFGWFWFLAKPFLYLLDYLSGPLGSFALAILVFTVMLKLVTLPLTLKSSHSMSRMKKLQPEIKRIQERFADDKMRQSQEMMELYKREKVSPLSGCMPTLIQIPIFFALYKVLYVGIEMRHAPFYGWIHDLSAPDPTSICNLFGLLPDWPSVWHINALLFSMDFNLGAWPILMGCTMFLQQRLSPQPPDKSQARMLSYMPLFFTYLLRNMPAGLVIYWTWSNILSTLQQWYIMRKDARREGNA